jgi:hypothetical protein
MQSARFIDSTATILYYGNKPPWFNDAKHIRLDSETEKTDYSQVHVFTLQKDEWKDVPEITLPYIGVLKKTPAPPRHRLVAMAVFKEDYKFIPAYVNYHKELGVEHFYLYYMYKSGPISLPRYPNVTYVEWDYPKYDSDGRSWAKLTAVNDFLYWSKHFADYVLFSDLNEFIQVRPDLTSEKMCYGFKNRLVELETPINIYDSIKNKNLEIFDWASNFPRKSKCIVSTKQVEAMGIHQPNIPRFNSENTEVLGEFFHVSGRV